MFFTKLWINRFFVASGLALSIYAIASYAAIGFRVGFLASLMLGLSTILVGLHVGEPKAIFRIPKWDLVLAAALMLLFGFIYSYRAYDFPHQMNEDEITIMTVAKEAATKPAQDILGPSTYFGFPLFIFWAFGKIGLAMGGVDLYHMRTIHALSGALIVVASYVLFRLGLRRGWALIAAIILGVNHSLFFISRFAMRDNTSLLFEIVALILLVAGWQKQKLSWTFLGGIAAGLTFYTYYPSRLTVAVWFGTTLIFGLLHRLHDWRLVLRNVVVALLSLTLTAMPIIISSTKYNDNNNFVSSTTLLSHDGRALQQLWVSAKSEQEGIYINVRNGLLAFNKPYSDLGYIYSHPGYGFVDILTGGLLWVGLGLIIIVAIKKRYKPDIFEVLMVAGFMLIWLCLTFIINKAPDYTRMLIVLPFVAYLAARGIEFVAWIVKIITRVSPAWASGLIGVTGVGLIIFNNAAIAADFYRRGLDDNTGLSNTVRYINDHQVDDRAKWYLAASSSTSYMSWGDDDAWKYWLGFFIPSHTLTVLHPPDFSPLYKNRLTASSKGYLLTNSELWEYLKSNFPYGVTDKTNITPDGRLIVVVFKYD